MMDTLFHIFSGYLTLKLLKGKLPLITKSIIFAVILGSYAPDFLTLFCYVDVIIHGQELSLLSNTGLWYYTKILHSIVFIPAILVIPAIFNVHIRVFLLGFMLHILIDIPTHTLDTGYYLFPIMKNLTFTGLFNWNKFKAGSSIFVINPVTYLLWVVLSLLFVPRHWIRNMSKKTQKTVNRRVKNEMC